MRETIPLPPTGWRGPAMPVRVKLDVVIRQEGKCASTGERLGTLAETQFDHRPPIHERRWDPVAQDTIPPVNDPAHIFAVKVKAHREETKRDVRRMGKVRRLRETTADHDEAMAAKEPGKPRQRKGSIRSRGFDKTRSRKMSGRTEART